MLDASKAVSSAAAGASEVERGLSKSHAPLKAAIMAMADVVQEREAILKGPALRVVVADAESVENEGDADQITGTRAAASSSSATSAAGGGFVRASRPGRSRVAVAAAPDASSSPSAAPAGRRKTLMGGGARRVARQ